MIVLLKHHYQHTRNYRYKMYGITFKNRF